MTEKSMADVRLEISAMEAVHAALKELEPEVQKRVLAWAATILGIDSSLPEPNLQRRDEDQSRAGSDVAIGDDSYEISGILDGVSAVAKRWITRNGLQPKDLSTIFNLGGDDLDLIANTVPGKSMKERMRSVFLLKGVAAYLGTGAARFTHEQMREACLHYDAFDAGNFAVHLKSISSEVTGTKDTGYTLTPRGLANATELVKSIIQR
jgi:hypothetical protein